MQEYTAVPATAERRKNSRAKIIQLILCNPSLRRSHGTLRSLEICLVSANCNSASSLNTLQSLLTTCHHGVTGDTELLLVAAELY